MIRREVTDVRHIETIIDVRRKDLKVEDGEHLREELLTVITRRAAVRTRDRLRNAARYRRKRPSEMYTERSRDR